ncbi:MAG: hypothetical protein V1790_17490 [Planctomycetota bacterium]
MPIQNRPSISDYAVAGTWTGTPAVAVGSRYLRLAKYPDPTPTEFLAHGRAAGNITFGFAPFSIPANAFAISVQVRYYDAEPSAGTNNLGGRLRVGGTYYASATHNPAGTTYTPRSDNWPLNPRTGLPWTVDDVNGIGANPLQHFGVISTDANPVIRISCIEIQVTYQAGDYTPTPITYAVVDNTFLGVPKADVKDKIEVEIGDLATRSAYLPQIKIKRWDNEANISIRLTDANLSVTALQANGVIEWKSSTARVRFYGIQSAEGGIEFEIYLASRPPVNAISMSVQQTPGVEWYYQPLLANVESDGSSWEIDAEGGRSDRPSHIGGSYAIYWENCPLNTTAGKIYRTGKLGHLFRPKAIDAVGSWVWGLLNYNAGSLTVTIPQAFLDSAAYPVIIDPVFGYDTAGGSFNGRYANYVYATLYALSEAANVSSISIYAAQINVNSTPQLGIYNNDSPAVLRGSTTTIAFVDATPRWYTKALVVSLAAASYNLCHNQPNTTNIYYDAGTYTNRYEASTFSTWPASIAAWDGTLTAVRTSIYATYTAAGGGLSIPVAMATYKRMGGGR